MAELVFRKNSTSNERGSVVLKVRPTVTQSASGFTMNMTLGYTAYEYPGGVVVLQATVSTSNSSTGAMVLSLTLPENLRGADIWRIDYDSISGGSHANYFTIEGTTLTYSKPSTQSGANAGVQTLYPTA